MITSKDLISYPWRRRPDVLASRFMSYLEKQKRKHPQKRISLSRAVLWTIKWPLLRLTFIETLFVFVRIFSAYVVKRLIDSYTDITIPTSESYKWAGALTACLVVAFHLEHHFNHLATYFPNHVQNALINLVFSKITRLSSDALGKLSSGRIINICTNGVNVFEQLGMFAANIFVGIFALIAGGALLWQYFGVSTLVGLGYLVFWYPWQELFIVLSLKERETTNRATANRLRTTSETLDAIRLLKMYTWEMKFKEKIGSLRKVELKMLKKSAITNAIIRGLSFSTQVCSSFLLFLTYALTGHTLTAGSVFSAYFVIGYLRLYSSYFFGLALNFLTDVRLLLKSIEQVLEAPEIGDVIFEKPQDPKNEAEFENFTAYWDTDSGPDLPQNKKSTIPVPPQINQNNHENAVLNNINLSIKKGSLNALVGAVGSGKTSLLMAFTGEMPKTFGSLRYQGNIAYCEQDPTIFAGTFRDNVLFGKPFDHDFYKTVIKACNLESDLKLFPNGDQSEIGERGNNLSGGQKARLALARAVYSQADIYLLDDPLSAVDPKVARSIYNNAIGKVLKGKTILLTTHQVDFARSCENIILMERGKVLGSGTYEQLKEQNIDVDKIFGNKQNKREEEHMEDVKVTEAKIAQDEKEDTDNQEGADDKQVKKDQYSVNVTWRTYGDLFKKMGGPWFFLFVTLVYISCEMANIGYGRMLGAWIAGTFPQWKCLAILGGLVGYDIFIYIVKYQLLGHALIRAAKKYHEIMLEKIIRATVYFFDTNPVGQILNRFSNDVGVLDKYIPLAFMDLSNISFVLASTVITVGIINPIILGPYAAVIFAIIVIVYLVFPSVKQTKLFELKSKGPLFSLMSATLSGLVIIRVYKQADVFQQKFKDFLHTTMKANISFVLCSRFMSFYVDMAYNIAAIGCVYIITAKSSGGGVSQGGLSAFALALVLSITGVLQHGLRQFSQLNISMSALARIQAYLDVPNEPPLEVTVDKELEEKGWPQKGDIELNKVFMKYRPEGDHVIKDLNLEVEAGKKIGCVGRTGAGKSTIIQLLYRMQEIDKSVEGGKDGFIKIDETNTQEVGLHLLRDNISLIPQSPFIFTGTIRLNVDPLGQFTDDEIWRALEDVRLKEHVERQPNGLDTHINTGSAVFSVGQKQLVCLARAILKHSNILIMDEATANMDYDTDNFIQKKIAERFDHATQFTIAHRLQTIADYDKVLVLDRGRRVEFDEPYRLLVKNIGDKELTNPDGYFSIMVQNTGPISSKKIFSITREAYFKRHENERNPNDFQNENEEEITLKKSEQ